jgi:hypothetical protein
MECWPQTLWCVLEKVSVSRQMSARHVLLDMVDLNVICLFVMENYPPILLFVVKGVLALLPMYVLDVHKDGVDHNVKMRSVMG